MIGMLSLGSYRTRGPKAAEGYGQIVNTLINLPSVGFQASDPEKVSVDCKVDARAGKAWIPGDFQVAMSGAERKAFL